MNSSPPYSEQESGETRMRKALVWNLGQITRDNGYKTTIQKVFTRPPSLAQISNNYPTVVALFGREIREGRDQSDQQWALNVPLVLMVYVEEANDVDLACERVKMDILSRFGGGSGDANARWMLPGEDGAETCLVMAYEGSEQFGMIMNQPKVGIMLYYSIRYRLDIGDPSILV